MAIYIQAADARFDSYLYVKKDLSADNWAEGSDEFFYIPHPRSKEREREFAAWRRNFRLIVSAATLSERAQEIISQVKEEFSRSDTASECWSFDHNLERRITITVIGSASEALIKKEYEAVSRLFLTSPVNFTCKYAGQPTP